MTSASPALDPGRRVCCGEQREHVAAHRVVHHVGFEMRSQQRRRVLLAGQREPNAGARAQPLFDPCPTCNSSSTPPERAGAVPR
ncbi:hypothetical protein [Sphingomonas sp.]|uniref:hypothetical protein n=1 Tax=Sphingomonas sp. TaxID=28214 RepID=UPI003BAB6601